MNKVTEKIVKKKKKTIRRYWKPIQIWVEPEIMKRLKRACQKDRSSLTRFVLQATIKAISNSESSLDG